MDKLLTVLFFASVTKALVEYIGTIFTNWGTFEKRLCSIIIGQIMAIGFQCDAFALVGMTSNVPFLGIVVTGVLIAGGSNVIYDAFNPDNKKVLIKDEEETIKDLQEKG